MGGSSPKAPAPPPPPPAPAPAPTIDTAAAEAQKQDDAASKRKGRAATVLTGSKGDLSTPSTATKTLLGQ